MYHYPNSDFQLLAAIGKKLSKFLFDYKITMHSQILLCSTFEISEWFYIEFVLFLIKATTCTWKLPEDAKTKRLASLASCSMP